VANCSDYVFQLEVLTLIHHPNQKSLKIRAPFAEDEEEFDTKIKSMGTSVWEKLKLVRGSRLEFVSVCDVTGDSQNGCYARIRVIDGGRVEISWAFY
jgi:hypothetical protein